MTYIVSQYMDGGGMRKIVVVLIVGLSLLVSPLVISVATAGDGQNSFKISPVVEQGKTDRFGGGEWIVVKAGDTRFGVIYGTVEHHNKLFIVADYKRYAAGIDVHDSEGNYLRSKGVPVWTVFAQSFDRMVEFRDLDDNYRFDLRRLEDSQVTSDIPVKGLSLIQAWTLSDMTQETSGDLLFVNFTLSIFNTRYTWSRELPNDDDVQKVALTFHIRVGVEDFTARVPWFKVVVSGGDERRLVSRSFEGWREYDGQRVNMSVKYDHDIQGWDFSHNDSALLLETRLMAGMLNGKETQERYRLQEGARIIEGDPESGPKICDDRALLPPEPRGILTEQSKGNIWFDDDWFRIGRFTWESDVTVDGEEEDMYFQVHGGGPMTFEYGRSFFTGFGIIGAFVYPEGSSIYHDPGFEAASFSFGIPTLTNLAPLNVLFLQLAVVGTAIGLAVVLRLTRKGRRKPLK